MIGKLKQLFDFWKSFKQKGRNVHAIGSRSMNDAELLRVAPNSDGSKIGCRASDFIVDLGQEGLASAHVNAKASTDRARVTIIVHGSNGASLEGH